MSVLQKIDLGTPPSGSDGDTVRSGNVKMNANTEVLDTVVPLGYQILSESKTLSGTDVGTRIGLFFQQAGGTVVLPLANTVRQNGVIHFFNIGFAVTIRFQGNDSASITRINAGDFVTYVSDGNAYWHIPERGKLGADEAVIGALSVGGALTVGAVTASGLITASAGVAVTGPLSIYGAATVDSLKIGGGATVIGKSTLADTAITGTLNVAGQLSSSGLRVNSANSVTTTLYSDTANEMVVEATSTGDSAQKYNINLCKYGGVVKTGRIYSRAGPTGQYTGATLWLDSGSGDSAYLGISGYNNNAAVQLRVSNSSTLDVVSWDAQKWASITCMSVTQTSDQALKDDVKDIREVLPLLRDKRIVTFRYKTPKSEGGGLSQETHIGVLAQDWAGDFPELVTELSAEIDQDGDFIAHQYDAKTGDELFGPDGPPAGRKALGFNYSNASAVAIQGVIELERLLATALARIEALEKAQP